MLENREGLPLEAAVAKAKDRRRAPSEGPISIIHVILQKSGPLDQVAG